MTTTNDDDIPSRIDLRDPASARSWTEEADRRRPHRTQIRTLIAELVRGAGARTVLELGSGPGQLAEAILDGWSLERYTLLDVSPPMLELARERVGRHPAARFVCGDFTQPGWSRELEPADAVVAMQSVHELRHADRLPELYAALRELTPLVVVADHAPTGFVAGPTASSRPSWYVAAETHHAALRAAGFAPETALEIEHMYVVVGRAR